MRPMLLLELLAAGACTLGGMHFWGVGLGNAPPVIPPTEDAGVVDDRVSRADQPPVHSGEEPSSPHRSNVSAPAVPGARTAESRPADSDPQAKSGIDRSGTAAPAGLPMHPKPRAARSAIAAIPPLAQKDVTAAPIPEQLARAALAFVGVDRAAEKTWADAINQSSLSADARSNLIEDLNEDGFPDPNNITAADLPLILARLRIIERMAPRAMDDVNTAAFLEAYKDLVDMLVRLAGANPR